MFNLGSQLVPELLANFTPEGTLSVTYGGSAITPGQNLSQTGAPHSAAPFHRMMLIVLQMSQRTQP